MSRCIRSFAATAAALLLACAATALVGPASAFQLAPPTQSCTTLNCAALSLPGRINSHPTSPALANPWVSQIAGLAGTCLRFQVTSQSHDLAMSVVAPNGEVFTNDTGGGACTDCPRVVVATGRAGYYTIVLSQRTGAAVQATFVLRAGVYDSGNSPNCSSPTPGD